MKKLITRSGHLIYLCLGLSAYIFYLERTAFLDISYHLFHILRAENFAIQNYRFGAVCTQLLPVIGCKLDFDLTTIMKLYSLGFVAYYYTIYLVITQGIKCYKLGFAAILLSTMMVTDTFYWMQSELPQGLMLMMLYFAIALKYKSRIALACLLFLNITLVFLHPLLIFPFSFLSLFFILEYSHKAKILKCGLIVFTALAVFKVLFFNTGYDTSSFSGLKYFFLYYYDYFSLESNIHFAENLVTKYYMLLLALLYISVTYFKEKEYLKLGLVLTFFFGYTLLINVSYPQGSDNFYLENLHLPLTVFVGIPFTWQLFKRNKTIEMGVVLAILVFRVVHIGIHHEPYTERVTYLNSVLEKTSSFTNKKLIVHEGQFDDDILLMSWGSPYEFWLLSTAFGDESRSILISEDPEKELWALDQNETFFTTWRKYKYTDLPRNKYFKFHDTSPYIYLRSYEN